MLRASIRGWCKDDVPYYNASNWKYGERISLWIQVQGHWDTSFGLCDTDFALIGFGTNSMDSRFNPVSITTVNSECHEAYEAAFTATKKGLFSAFNLVKECGVDGCTLYQFIKRHDIRDLKTLRVEQLDAAPQKFTIAKPSSDNCAAFRRRKPTVPIRP